MQTKDAIRTIKERLSIVDIVGRYVELKRNGSRLWAPCPFHQETAPSFSVNESMGTFHCFGCQASGDIFEFYSKINGIDFRETLEQLANETGITLDWHTDRHKGGQQKAERGKRQEILRMYALAANHFASNLLGNNAENCRQYIEQRGLSAEIQKQFALGWACDAWQDLEDVLRRAGFAQQLAIEAGLLGLNKYGKPFDRFRARLIFPIKNLSDQVIAFGGRIIVDCDEAKYINSADSPIYKKGEHLYGLAQARRGISSKGHALLTEGYMDVLTLHQFGHDNAVGGLGTALTQDQVKRLAGFTSKIILLYDADSAGRKAALNACNMFLTGGLTCSVVLMPDGEDIDTYLRKFGNDAFGELLEAAPDGLTFCINAVRQMAPRDGVEWVHDFLKKLASPELVNKYVGEFAHQLQFSEDALRSAVTSAQGKQIQARQSGQQPSSAIPVIFSIREQQILMFALRYPHRFNDLLDIGADFLLESPPAKKLWQLVEKHGEDIAYHLDDTEKDFWATCCGDKTPPRNEASAEIELSALKKMLHDFYMTSHSASVRAAIHGPKIDDDFATNMVYLDALQQTVEQIHEQS